MAANPKVGLEVEMHGFDLILKRPASTMYAKGPGPGVNNQDLFNYLIGEYPIFCPVADQNYKLANTADDLVQWTGDWGLRAVADSFSTASWEVENKPPLGSTTVTYTPYTVGKCVVELQTAAHDIRDVNYWVFARRSMQAFRSTMAYFDSFNATRIDDLVVLSNRNDRWYPVQAFLNAYNAAIDAIQAPNGFIRDRFKLRLSDRLTAFVAGTSNHAGANNRWNAYFCVVRNFDVTPYKADAGHASNWAAIRPATNKTAFSDTQLSYDMNLGSLWANMPGWIAAWGSTWMSRVPVPFSDFEAQLDPLNGLERWQSTVLTDVYNLQAYITLWRTAQIATTSYLTNAQNGPAYNALTVDERNALGGLVCLLFVAGAVKWTGQAGGNTEKNGFPQLFKTSPRSIAEAIRTPGQQAGVGAANVTTFMQSLAQQNNVNDAINQWATTGATFAAQSWPGPGPFPDGMPVGMQWSRTPMYSTGSSYTVKPFGQQNAYFENMWKGTFDINGTAVAYNAAGKLGFKSDAPFFVPWASETHSSKAATRIPGANPGSFSVSILIESRYNSCKLNQGFNPFAIDAMFKQSYIGLLTVLTPTTVANDIVTVDALFPGAAGQVLTQNFLPAGVNGPVYQH